MHRSTNKSIVTLQTDSQTEKRKHQLLNRLSGRRRRELLEATGGILPPIDHKNRTPKVAFVAF